MFALCVSLHISIHVLCFWRHTQDKQMADVCLHYVIIIVVFSFVSMYILTVDDSNVFTMKPSLADIF